MNVFDELEARGMIAQTTDRERIRELLGGEQPMSFYIGFDPRPTVCMWDILYSLWLWRICRGRDTGR